MKLKLLHISDLHFKSENVLQDIVLTSMFKKIEELCKIEDKPNMLVITGDIAFGGKTDEYYKAKDFIDKISSICQIKTEMIFIIPGNHDIDRDKIKDGYIEWWYSFKGEVELNNILSSSVAFPIIKSTSDAYHEFINQYMNGKTTIGKFGEYVSQISFGDYTLKIVGINSSLFCGYDGDDKKKLALGLQQVNSCFKDINVEKEIVISCMHHPFECYHICDKPSLNVIHRISDIILSGHVHEQDNSFRKEVNSGETIFISAGAAYEKRNSQNGFNIIELNSRDLKGIVTFYKYIPDDHKWVKNLDINSETEGVFNFEIKRGKIDSIKEKIKHDQPEKGNTTYMFVLDGKFNELDRPKFQAIEAHLKNSFKDVNGTITKIERSSIKIYFESKNDLKDSQSIIKQIEGLEIIEIQKTKDEVLIKTKLDKSVYHWKTFLKPKYSEKIIDPGANYIHTRASEDITLKDLYVSPNFKVINIEDNAKENTEKVINADKALIKEIGKPMKIVVYGSESSGKSTLTKWWYDKYYEQGYIPILLSGTDIKDINVDRIKKLVHHEFSNQYNEVFEGNLDDFDEDRIIIIVDDFHKIKFSNSKFKANLISNLKKTYQNLFLTGNDLMQFETYSLNAGISKNILKDFKQFLILEFGPILRYELIRKWNNIGSDQLEPNELIRLNNETEKHVESIIGKSFVPSFPVYLLTILQAKDASFALKPEYSIHGFYYELLINEALNKAVKNKADISLYYNFITEYSYFLFSERIRMKPLYIDDFLKFYNKYCLDYKIEISPKLILDNLINSKLLRMEDNKVCISYKYVYYFFVAKFLANNISNNKEIRNIVTLLCQRVYRDEFACIVMFLTHLSKDQFILNQLIENSKTLFKEYKPLQLQDDVSFINEMIKKLPDQIYQPIDVKTIKQEELKEEEKLSEQEKQFDASRDLMEYDIYEDINSLDVLSNLIRATKTIEIIGQVTKKYWGELKAGQKYDLAEETYMLGLRTLGFYFSLLGENTDILVEYLKHIYRKKNVNKNISKEDVDKASRNFLFGLCTLASFGIVRRVSNAIGYEKLSGTFQDILLHNDFNSVKLIDVSIKLDHSRTFPWEELENLKKETDKNYLASVLLKNLVINYMYVFVTSEKDKQKLCALFGIKMEQQRMIDGTSLVKKESVNKKLQKK